jgi:two-component system LytT family response regulator
MKIKAIIVEDEEQGMNVLSIKIATHCPDVEIIDKCYTYDEAIKSIESNNPELVFLDVRLDRKTGFDVLRRLAYIHFEVIFITGYDQYAQQALKEGALDYILKPVNVKELKGAVEKAQKAIKRYPDVTRIIVPIAGGIRIIPLKDVIYCLADDNATKIFVVNEKRFVYANINLGKLEAKLPPIQFCRIHRKSIINLCFVKEYKRTAGGLVIMQNEDELSISRDRKDNFLKQLSDPMDFCTE